MHARCYPPSNAGLGAQPPAPKPGRKLDAWKTCTCTGPTQRKLGPAQLVTAAVRSRARTVDASTASRTKRVEGEIDAMRSSMAWFVEVGAQKEGPSQSTASENWYRPLRLTHAS